MFFGSEDHSFLFGNAVGRKKFKKNKTTICFAIHPLIPNYGIFIRKLLGKTSTSEVALILPLSLDVGALNFDQGHASTGNI